MIIMIIYKYFRTSFSDNSFSLYTIFIIIRIESRTFLIIVKGFQTSSRALVMKSSA